MKKFIVVMTVLLVAFSLAASCDPVLSNTWGVPWLLGCLAGIGTGITSFYVVWG